MGSARSYAGPSTTLRVVATVADRTDTLLGQCIARAMLADGVRRPEEATAWQAFKSSHRGSRVAAFLIEWALAVRELGEGQSHAAIARWSGSERTFYRRLADFRALFGDEADPEPIAVAIAERLPAKPGAAELSGQIAIAL